jgi:hypothetical protein
MRWRYLADFDISADSQALIQSVELKVGLERNAGRVKICLHIDVSKSAFNARSEGIGGIPDVPSDSAKLEFAVIYRAETKPGRSFGRQASGAGGQTVVCAYTNRFFQARRPRRIVSAPDFHGVLLDINVNPVAQVKTRLSRFCG